MSFHQSAEDVRVDDGHILRARIPNANGDMVDAECDLDQCLGNNNGTFWRPGSFEWGGSNFSGSGQNISFSMEGDAQVPVLRAELGNADGQNNPADVNLAERIGNQDGQLVFS